MHLIRTACVPCMHLMHARAAHATHAHPMQGDTRDGIVTRSVNYIYSTIANRHDTK